MRIHLALILLMCGCAPSPRIQLGSESSESQFTLTFPSQAKTFQIVFHALPEATVLWRVETPRTEGGAAEATGSREVNLNYGSVPATLTQTFPSGGAKPRQIGRASCRERVYSNV